MLRISALLLLACLAFIDLDNFKHYNDTFGHEVGDRLLIWFSEILNKLESDRCQVCRWGGDEFVVIVLSEDYEKRLDHYGNG